MRVLGRRSGHGVCCGRENRRPRDGGAGYGKTMLDAALKVVNKGGQTPWRLAVKLPKQSYRADDRLFAILQQPDVALLLTCDAPASWTAMVFDFAEKKAVASANNHLSVSDAQKYLISQVRE